LNKLRVEKYERVQAIGEPLAVYVQAIKDAAAVLRIGESEKEMVARIVDGFHTKGPFCFPGTSVFICAVGSFDFHR
jgi:hypothetical protein